MKKLLMALAVGTALTVPQMPASAACIHANPPEVHIPECVDAVDGPSIGGCSFVAATDAVAGQGQMTGEIDIEAVVYSATNPADNPMSATFTCYIKVNGSTQPGAIVTASGIVVVVGGGVITYTSNSVTDFVQLCQDVSYSNGQSTSECFEASTFEIPPPIVWEVIDMIFETIAPYEAAFWAIVDPIVCDILAQLDDFDVPGVLYVNSQGDVWVLDEGIFDCPTYGNVFGQPPNG